MSRSASAEGQSAVSGATQQRDGTKDRDNGRHGWPQAGESMREASGRWLQRTSSKEAWEKKSYSSGMVAILMSIDVSMVRWSPSSE